jgi:hypothetical protein
MNETTEMWKHHRDLQKARRAERRGTAPAALTAAGIPFTSSNEGAHLIVSTSRGSVDFWPGTELWIPRFSPRTRRYGVESLIKWIKPSVETEQIPGVTKETRRCSYPDCNCPFDAPADPKWCARGYTR